MNLRIPALLAAGALALLLLFGCLGGAKGQQGQSASQPAQQSGGPIGDADISASTGEDEAVLPGEDLTPPPVDEALPSGLTLDDSDIGLGVIEDDMVISEEDIVEPV